MRRLALSVFTLPFFVLACSDSDTGTPGTGDTDVNLSDSDVLDTAPDTTDTTLDDTDTAVPDTDTDATIPDTDTTVPDATDTTPSDTNDLQICLPGTYICTAHNLRTQCMPDGKSYGNPTPCGEDEACRNGVCTPRCPNDPKFGVYVGCEFWATDLPNYPDPTLTPHPKTCRGRWLSRTPVPTPCVSASRCRRCFPTHRPTTAFPAANRAPSNCPTSMCRAPR